MKASLRSFPVSELEFSIKASSNFKSQLVSSSIRLRLTFVLKKLGGARGFAAVNAQGLKIKGVEDIIAVASGKGGVGKSTTAVNLAVALANKCRLKVGLLDADVYGPSIPTMMKLHGKPEVSEDKKMIPIENHGVKCMSMGFLLAEKYAPIVWRGPMVMKALEQMSRGVEWGNLDILLVDMPPGTGDAQISISQRLQLSGIYMNGCFRIHPSLQPVKHGYSKNSAVHAPGTYRVRVRIPVWLHAYRQRERRLRPSPSPSSVTSKQRLTLTLIFDPHPRLRLRNSRDRFRPSLTLVCDFETTEIDRLRNTRDRLRNSRDRLRLRPRDSTLSSTSTSTQLSTSTLDPRLRRRWIASQILGLLENMSFFKCPHCGEPSHIFGKGGARKTADEMGLQFLGEIPLEVEIRSCSDEGVPVVISNPDSTVSKAYSDVALKVVSRLEELSKQQQLRPEINL
ncbi:hypothetical protein HYC85_031346 [Camellia sinensis]|uniref:Iron-sulfur protein NUBPL n=1 Tax=Camellia sinensis TaxID=4442 RepID=A0A7J7FQC6_CAMSI|nr:hypothetical protein HYC85_031346 [Camellia sinensis]